MTSRFLVTGKMATTLLVLTRSAYSHEPDLNGMVRILRYLPTHRTVGWSRIDLTFELAPSSDART